MLLLYLLVPCLEAWQVEEANHFQYSFAIALLRNDVHICNGALYRSSLALVPSLCIKGRVNRTRVEVFRHNLDVTSAEEAKAKPRWSPYAGISYSEYYRKAPQTTKITKIYIFKELAILHLELVFDSEISLHKYQDRKRMKMVGWGDTQDQLLLKTTLPISLVSHCKPIAALDQIRQLCIRERVLEKLGTDFKRGALLINYANARPNLLGIMFLQYRTGDGAYVASLIRMSKFISHIDSLANQVAPQ